MGSLSSLIRPLEDIAAMRDPVLAAARGHRQRRLGGHLGVDHRCSTPPMCQRFSGSRRVPRSAVTPRFLAEGGPVPEVPFRHSLWVDAMQYGRAEDLLIRFMRLVGLDRSRPTG